MRVIDDSFRGGVAITPSDTAIFAPTRALFIGGAGNIKVDMVDGTTITLNGIEVGDIHPLSVTKVYLTGTTATNIVALY